MVAAVAEACRTVLEFHIHEELPLEAKIWKLAMGIYDAKAKVARVQFELNMES